MECLTEFKCSVFVDGELPQHDLREVEEHLEACKLCTAMVAELREENQLLLHCIQEFDLVESHQVSVATSAAALAHPARSARPASPIDVAKFGGLIVGTAALLRVVTSSPENFVLPSSLISLDWLDPSSFSGRLNWLVNAGVYVATEGVSRMISLVNDLSGLALLALVLMGLVMMVRRTVGKNVMMAALSVLGTVALTIAMSASSTYAMDVRTPGKDKAVVVPAGQVVDDSMFAAGESITIDGIINGDLIALARRVIIHGTVKGNVITGAQSIQIDGTIEGTLITGGQAIQVDGKVMRNVVGFAQNFTIGKDANVGGDAGAFANEFHMNGTLGRSLYAFGIAEVTGNVGRNVVFRGDTISVLPGARIAGDLTSYVSKAEGVHVEQGSTIGGKQAVEVRKPSAKQASNEYTTFGFYFWQALHVAAAFVSGLILFLLCPGLRRVNFGDVMTVLKSGGIGFLAVVATPIAAIILMVTVIGIPIGIVGFVVWMLGMYLSKVVIANFVGRTLLTPQNDGMSGGALGLLVGLVLVFVVINLPFVGGLVHFLLVLIGFGALLMGTFDAYQKRAA